METIVCTFDKNNEGGELIEKLKLNIQINADGEEYNLRICPKSKSERMTLSLKLIGEKMMEFDIDDIVYMESIDKNNAGKGEAASSNNKRVYFRNRKPGVIADFTFATDLDNNLFPRISKSVCVNVREMKNRKGNYIYVKAYGLDEEIKLKVSSKYDRNSYGSGRATK